MGEGAAAGFGSVPALMSFHARNIYPKDCYSCPSLGMVLNRMASSAEERSQRAEAHRTLPAGDLVSHRGWFMISEKICRKCDKQYPSSIVFCPDCGSLTMRPEPEARVASNTRSKRATRAAPVMAPPVQREPPKVRTEHTMEDLFTGLALNDVPQEDIESVRRLIEWSERFSSSASFGDSVADGGRVGYRPSVQLKDRQVALFWLTADGRIEVLFEEWINVPPFDSREKRVEMLGRFNSIRGVKIAENRIAGRAPVPVKMLRDRSEHDTFVQTFEWAIALARGE